MRFIGALFVWLVFGVSTLNALEFTAVKSSKSAIEVDLKAQQSLIVANDLLNRLKNVTSCSASRAVWSESLGACTPLVEFDSNSATQSKYAIPTNCTAANQIPQWDHVNNKWYCKSVIIPVDCRGTVNIGSQCDTREFSLLDGGSGPVSCDGDFGDCTATAHCLKGNLSVSNEYCTPPSDCYDAVSGAGCSNTLKSVAHDTSDNWSCESGYVGECKTSCWDGTFTNPTNACSVKGTWVPVVAQDCPATCGGKKKWTHECQGGVCLASEKPADYETDCEACGSWSYGRWGGCSTTACGATGTQTRTVTCSKGADNKCDLATKPATSQSCAGTCSACGSTTIDTCLVFASSHGGGSSACKSGYIGNCSYTCNDGRWIKNSNNCEFDGDSCPARTMSGCYLGASQHDESVGQCSSQRGYSGSCSYRCNDGDWSKNSNSCKRSCSSSTVSNCSVSSRSHNGSSGSCASTYSGSCSYTCNDGTWSRNSNNCGRGCNGDTNVTLSASGKSCTASMGNGKVSTGARLSASCNVTGGKITAGRVDCTNFGWQAKNPVYKSNVVYCPEKSVPGCSSSCGAPLQNVTLRATPSGSTYETWYRHNCSNTAIESCDFGAYCDNGTWTNFKRYNQGD